MTMVNDFNNMPKKLKNDEDLDLVNIDVEDDDDDDGIDTENNNKDDDDESKMHFKLPKNNSKTKIDIVSKEDIKDSRKNRSIKKLSEVNRKNSTSDDKENELNSNLDEEGDYDSKFFVVRVSGGQENLIASMLQSRLSTKKIDGIYSILFLDNFKGYVIVEAMDSNVAHEALHGIRNIRGQIRGELPFKDLEGYLIKKPVVTELVIDDTVEIIAGPFKSMKAKIMRVDYEKQEATVVLLDSPYQIPVTVDANYLKKAL